ncbi:hypothetical protein Mpet_2504 [Methanolacinia petrolearia DSM 11571]|uniref:Uncharacterized protein n=1 Tax=Methanolacinia petrolearia (strain DSM 11571 / OCM 486 / SEBR 4847) TaxID=679926 RepID=E1RF04_METP4|nr:hypothetical protein [Methanolacinia petrolearia]ADN37248.1 hypothetical protein Mpet_2504 [Methanolacinia petrolearia DSM 11571]
MKINGLKITAAISFLLLIWAVTGAAGAYSISAEANESQLEIIKEIYGQEMTQGEFWATVYPEEYAMMKENMSPAEFENFSNMEKYWGDDHPELPYGANVWDENGPVNLNEISPEEKEEFGLDGVIVDDSGYIILGYDNDVEGAKARLESYGDVSGENFLSALATAGIYGNSPLSISAGMIEALTGFFRIA